MKRLLGHIGTSVSGLEQGMSEITKIRDARSHCDTVLKQIVEDQKRYGSPATEPGGDKIKLDGVSL